MKAVSIKKKQKTKTLLKCSFFFCDCGLVVGQQEVDLIALFHYSPPKIEGSCQATLKNAVLCLTDVT